MNFLPNDATSNANAENWIVRGHTKVAYWKPETTKVLVNIYQPHIQASKSYQLLFAIVSQK